MFIIYQWNLNANRTFLISLCNKKSISNQQQNLAIKIEKQIGKIARNKSENKSIKLFRKKINRHEIIITTHLWIRNR